MSAPLRLGTRASALATTQSGLVADLVRAQLGREVELVEITTEGDTSSAPLAQLGGTGVFVSALRALFGLGIGVDGDTATLSDAVALDPELPAGTRLSTLDLRIGDADARPGGAS